MGDCMWAIVDIQGRQIKVAAGDKIVVNRCEGEVGDTLTFDSVYGLGKEDGSCVWGAPQIDKAKVTARISEHTRGKKIIVFKYLKKNRSKKMRGHRQPYTSLEVTEIHS
jgi:large subunit ribosomal protein L21